MINVTMTELQKDIITYILRGCRVEDLQKYADYLHISVYMLMDELFGFLNEELYEKQD